MRHSDALCCRDLPSRFSRGQIKEGKTPFLAGFNSTPIDIAFWETRHEVIWQKSLESRQSPMDGQSPARTAVRRRVISFKDPIRYILLSTCLSQCQPGDSSADNDDRVLKKRCIFRHFIGVTRWRLGRHAGFSFDRNMLQGTLWFDIVALFQLILLHFVRPIPLLEAFACDAAARRSAAHAR